MLLWQKDTFCETPFLAWRESEAERDACRTTHRRCGAAGKQASANLRVHMAHNPSAYLGFVLDSTAQLDDTLVEGPGHHSADHCHGERRPKEALAGRLARRRHLDERLTLLSTLPPSVPFHKCGLSLDCNCGQGVTCCQRTLLAETHLLFHVGELLGLLPALELLELPHLLLQHLGRLPAQRRDHRSHDGVQPGFGCQGPTYTPVRLPCKAATRGCSSPTRACAATAWRRCTEVRRDDGPRSSSSPVAQMARTSRPDLRAPVH
jgi:hypothetical protein